jgi:hypothetical protein
MIIIVIETVILRRFCFYVVVMVADYANISTQS